MRVLRRMLAGTALVFGAARCGQDGGVAGPAAVATVAVTPASDTLDALGRTVQLGATARDGAGNVLAGRPVTWSSSAPTVASVDPATGVVTAQTNGQATIRATVDGVMGSAALVVAQSVAGVTVTPGTAGLTSLGAIQQFAAAARDALNNPVVGVRFLWLSSDPAVATIDTLGRAVARRTGTTTITAAAEGIPGYAGLSVTQSASALAFRVHPPTTTVAGEPFAVAIQVEVRDAGGALVPDAQPPVTLTASTGVLRGTTTVHAIGGIASFSGQWMEQAGTGLTITAASPAIQQAVSAAFAVTHAAPAAVAFVSPPADDTAGSPLGIVARIRDRFGNTATGATDVVRLRVSAGPAGGALFGDTAVAAQAGVATFPATHLRLAAAGYAIRAVAAGLDSARSDAFTITHARGHHLTVESDSQFILSLNEPAAAVPVMAVRDSFANLAVTENHLLTLSLATVPWPPAQLFGAVTAPTVNGIATFENWRVTRPAGNPHYRLAVTAPGLVPDTLALLVGFSTVLVFAGDVHACTITAYASAAALCWGGNSAGQLGPGAGGAVDSVPAFVAGGFAELTAGERHTCGRTTTSSAWCWGANENGQLGAGAPSGGGPTPVQVQGGTTWGWLTAGGSHTCGLAADSTAYCWGDNANGQLGDDTAPTDRAAPAPIYGGRQYIRLAAGREHTCAIAADSAAYCWGRGDLGQLGHGAFAGSDTAVLVQGGQKYTGIVAGDHFTCAVAARGGANVDCWGADDAGQLGDGVVGPNRATPGLVGGGVIVSTVSASWQMAAGLSHACVVGDQPSDHVWCWGSNSEGQLGPAGGTGSATPVIAMSGTGVPNFDYATIGAGRGHTCAAAWDATLVVTRGIYCWGRNAEGQLGIGSRGPGTATPTRAIQ